MFKTAIVTAGLVLAAAGAQADRLRVIQPVQSGDPFVVIQQTTGPARILHVVPQDSYVGPRDHSRLVVDDRRPCVRARYTVTSQGGRIQVTRRACEE